MSAIAVRIRAQYLDASSLPPGAIVKPKSLGDVVDSSKVEAGSGRTVKGMNDYEGEITGNPAPNSRFCLAAALLVTDLPSREEK